MTRTITSKATWDQHVALAKYLQSKGLTASTTVEWFKAKKYIVNNLRYEATRVSAVIAGIESVTCAPVQSLEDTIALVNSEISAGTLHYTKAKQVHIVTPTVASIDAPPN